MLGTFAMSRCVGVSRESLSKMCFASGRGDIAPTVLRKKPIGRASYWKASMTLEFSWSIVCW